MKADKKGEGVKTGGEDRSNTLLEEGEGEGGRVTGEKIETKTEKETDTLRNRLYLGTPRCGGLV